MFNLFGLKSPIFFLCVIALSQVPLVSTYSFCKSGYVCCRIKNEGLAKNVYDNWNNEKKRKEHWRKWVYENMSVKIHARGGEKDFFLQDGYKNVVENKLFRNSRLCVAAKLGNDLGLYNTDPLRNERLCKAIGGKVAEAHTCRGKGYANVAWDRDWIEYRK